MRCKKGLWMALLASVVMAGCTASLPSLQGGGQTGSGITPRDGLDLALETQSRSFTEAEKVGLRLSLRNTGGSAATEISATLKGASFFTDGNCGGKVTREVAGLRAASEALGETGGEDSLVWRCSHGLNLGSGQSDSFEAQAEVSYNYQTNARTSFTIIPSGESLTGSSLPETDNSPSPVHADIGVSTPRAAAPPLLPVTISNVGTGMVKGKVKYELSMPAVETLLQQKFLRQGVKQENLEEKINGWKNSNGWRGSESLVRKEASIEIGLPETIKVGDKKVEVFSPSGETTYRASVNLVYTYEEVVESQTFRIEGMAGDQTGEAPGDEGGDGSPPGGEDGDGGEEKQPQKQEVSWKSLEVDPTYVGDGPTTYSAIFTFNTSVVSRDVLKITSDKFKLQNTVNEPLTASSITVNLEKKDGVTVPKYPDKVSFTLPKGKSVCTEGGKCLVGPDTCSDTVPPEGQDEGQGASSCG